MLKKVVLAIIDGWGVAPAWGGNAIEMAKTPKIDELWQKYPHTLLKAAEEAVGLPRHEPGNSEVGHLNIGCGGIVRQNLPGITATINDGTFFKNPVVLGAFDHVKKNSSNLHFLGLVSDGGIHSHIDHLFALLKMAKESSIAKVYIHFIADGRDTDPMKALNFIAELKKEIERIGLGQIATVMGRYYAMDRDKHWDRIKLAFDVLASGIGPIANSAEQAVSENYRQNRTDEFILPTIISGNDANFAPIAENDAVIFFNFRADRAREITRAFTEPNFRFFERKVNFTNLYFATFAYLEEYNDNPNIKSAFHIQENNYPLAKVIAEAGLKQLHVAETEKYAHVTFFFNGGIETPFRGENRILIQSPKVATFDLKPEMAAPEVTRKVIEEFAKYDFTVLNFANPDMVGHSGNIKATIKACETVDACVGEIAQAVLDKNAVFILTADHGNAEEMINPASGESYTEHTINPVPFILCSDNEILERPLDTNSNRVLALCDIAPTICDIMELEKPSQMTGNSLLVNK